ncbi:hypothetical protein ACJX0J_041043, partial [Zea mays]
YGVVNDQDIENCLYYNILKHQVMLTNKCFIQHGHGHYMGMATQEEAPKMEALLSAAYYGQDALHKRIIFFFKHKPSFLWQKIIVKKYFHGKDLYNIKRPLCTIDPELYEICDDKFILVKDARIKNWQLFDGYQFALQPKS